MSPKCNKCSQDGLKCSGKHPKCNNCASAEECIYDTSSKTEKAKHVLQATTCHAGLPIANATVAVGKAIVNPVKTIKNLKHHAEPEDTALLIRAAKKPTSAAVPAAAGRTPTYAGGAGDGDTMVRGMKGLDIMHAQDAAAAARGSRKIMYGGQEITVAEYYEWLKEDWDGDFDLRCSLKTCDEPRAQYALYCEDHLDMNPK